MPHTLDLSFLRSRTSLRRIALVSVASAALGGLYALLAPSWYRSVLTVVPAKPQRSGISSVLGTDLGGLAAGLESSMGGADGPRIAAVLQSIEVSDAVIAKFDLRSRYRQKFQEEARAALWHHCDVETLPKPNLVQLSCEDKDPRFVQAMLAYFAEYANRVFRRVSVSSASEEVRFLDKRVAELRQQADDAASRMREFQERYKIVDLDTQARAVVSALAALNSQRITKQLELDYARTFSAGDETTTRQLESQLWVMRENLRELEEPSPAAPAPADMHSHRRGTGSRNGLFPAALEVPKLRAEFERLFRERKVAEVSLVFALERLEGAKANEARDVSTFLVLDPPALPTLRARPKRLQTLIGVALLGFLAAMGFEWLKSGGAAAVTSSLRSVGILERQAPTSHEEGETGSAPVLGRADSVEGRP